MKLAQIKLERLEIQGPRNRNRERIQLWNLTTTNSECGFPHRNPEIDIWKGEGMKTQKKSHLVLEDSDAGSGPALGHLVSWGEGGV